MKTSEEYVVAAIRQLERQGVIPYYTFVRPLDEAAEVGFRRFLDRKLSTRKEGHRLLPSEEDEAVLYLAQAFSVLRSYLPYLASSQFATVCSVLNSLLSGFQVRISDLRNGTTIYRSVRLSDKPLRQSQVSHPPSRLQTHFSRACPPGHVLLYGSLSEAATLRELAVRQGEKLAISSWTVTNDLHVAEFGYLDNECPAFSRGVRWPDDSALYTKTDIAIKEFMRQEFTAPVPSGEEYRYMLTAALVNPLVESEPVIDGIVYPSVVMDTHTDNVALNPSPVRESLRLSLVQHVEVSKADDCSYRLKILDTTSGVSSNGHLLWNG